MSRTTIVIPCYNESGRLDAPRFTRFAAGVPDHTHLLFVDDASSDDTGAIIDRLCASIPGRATRLSLARNRGKGEAVRQGLRAAIEGGAELVGFWDADLSTPLEAVPGFVEYLETHPQIHTVLGSRVKLLGRRIERRLARHLAGRVFATMASLVLQLPVYDTQCGAKLFRVTPALDQVLAEPFLTRWVFDVELLARFARQRRRNPSLLSLEQSVYEFPLLEWHDVPGSKLRPWSMIGSAVSLLRVWIKYR